MCFNQDLAPCASAYRMYTLQESGKRQGRASSFSFPCAKEVTAPLVRTLHWAIYHAQSQVLNDRERALVSQNFAHIFSYWNVTTLWGGWYCSKENEAQRHACSLLRVCHALKDSLQAHNQQEGRVELKMALDPISVPRTFSFTGTLSTFYSLFLDSLGTNLHCNF